MNTPDMRIDMNTPDMRIDMNTPEQDSDMDRLKRLLGDDGATARHIDADGTPRAISPRMTWVVVRTWDPDKTHNPAERKRRFWPIPIRQGKTMSTITRYVAVTLDDGNWNADGEEHEHLDAAEQEARIECGRVIERVYTWEEDIVLADYSQIRCVDCRGTGDVIRRDEAQTETHESCPTCDGAGWVSGLEAEGNDWPLTVFGSAEADEDAGDEADAGVDNPHQIDDSAGL